MPPTRRGSGKSQGGQAVQWQRTSVGSFGGDFKENVVFDFALGGIGVPQGTIGM